MKADRARVDQRRKARRRRRVRFPVLFTDVVADEGGDDGQASQGKTKNHTFILTGTERFGVRILAPA